ncbi:unnamed protein product [Protopolystoma xenopodis]|uniref:Uncharacterized protein n=1 Tax=Protopolystoma xenopodis TaxID=117903 RepID=A0A3S5C6C4_9PLAT|nr:unnamed protein product [Protopolystoma xenopodis]
MPTYNQKLICRLLNSLEAFTGLLFRKYEHLLLLLIQEISGAAAFFSGFRGLAPRRTRHLPPSSPPQPVRSGPNYDPSGVLDSFAEPETSADYTWGWNYEEFRRRFDPAVQSQGLRRLRNLFFPYLVELRALSKAAPYLSRLSYFTGSPEGDKDTREAVFDLLSIIR